jgi:hypothetical protein
MAVLSASSDLNFRTGYGKRNQGSVVLYGGSSRIGVGGTINMFSGSSVLSTGGKISLKSGIDNAQSSTVQISSEYARSTGAITIKSSSINAVIPSSHFVNKIRIASSHSKTLGGDILVTYERSSDPSEIDTTTFLAGASSENFVGEVTLVSRNVKHFGFIMLKFGSQ